MARPIRKAFAKRRLGSGKGGAADRMGQLAQALQHLTCPVAVGIAAERLQQQHAAARIQMLGIGRKLAAGQGAPQAPHRGGRLWQHGAAQMPQGVHPAAAARVGAGFQHGKAAVDGHGPAVSSPPELEEQEKTGGLQLEGRKTVEPPDVPQHGQQTSGVAGLLQTAQIFQNGFALDVLRQMQKKGSQRFTHERPPKI